MQLLKKIFLPLLFITTYLTAKAADTTQLPVRIAVMLPLNLDSAFKGYQYNLSNTKISQYFLSGLEFYNGVTMAIDSLQKENANLEVWVYDMHKQNQSLQQLTTEMQALNFSLLIASFTTSAEQKTVSDFSAKNSIPVISATFPNDINLNNNPFFLMVNPTWKTHINAIYNYLSKNYKGKKIILFTRKGSMEDRIANEISKLNSKRAINLSTVILSDNFSDTDVISHLSNSSQNIIVCGSLLEGFGKDLIKILNDNGLAYANVLVGMPTWSGMSGITGTDSENLQIIITSPYNYLNKNLTLESIEANYKTLYYTRPSDMVLKGYETMYHFSKLLLANPGTFINKSSDSTYKISNDYNFQPVRLLPTSFIPDYLENKKIYFIKIANGRIQSID
ncbi:MAG TPA: ABC transporter substrate-binding protein [Parafilimonas sp.]|nr:ABC transporter substrate-binding protein [Parafilimonas sp.]